MAKRFNPDPSTQNGSLNDEKWSRGQGLEFVESRRTLVRDDQLSVTSGEPLLTVAIGGFTNAGRFGRNEKVEAPL